MGQQLENSRIVIAGGTSGIGWALAKILVGDKALVTVIGRDPAKLKAVKEELPPVTAMGVDAGDRAALDAFFRAQKEVDHLVIALSGAKGGGMFNTLAVNDLREGFDNKFWPHVNVLQAALPYMHRTGSITLITAISATAKLPGTAGLAAINAALESMVPILSRELAPLRVNAVSPGVIDTPWWNFLPEDAKSAAFAGYAAGIAVGRVGRPEEVADTIRHLITSTYINGIVVGCHGGLS